MAKIIKFKQNRAKELRLHGGAGEVVQLGPNLAARQERERLQRIAQLESEIKHILEKGELPVRAQLEELCSLAPKSSYVVLGHAAWNYCDENYANALTLIEQALALDPKNRLALRYQLGCCSKLAEQGEFDIDRLLLLIEEALAAAPDDFNIIKFAAKFYIEELGPEHYSRAEPLIKAGLKLRPSDPLLLDYLRLLDKEKKEKQLWLC